MVFESYYAYRRHLVVSLYYIISIEGTKFELLLMCRMFMVKGLMHEYVSTVARKLQNGIYCCTIYIQNTVSTHPKIWISQTAIDVSLPLVMQYSKEFDFSMRLEFYASLSFASIGISCLLLHIWYSLSKIHYCYPSPNFKVTLSVTGDYIALSESLLSKHKLTHDATKEFSCQVCSIVHP